MTKPPALGITEIAFEAVWRVWRLRVHVARIMFLPALAIGALTYFALHLDADPNAPVRWAAYFARSFVLAFAAVSCHRLILLGPNSLPRFGADGSTTREWKFVLLVVLVSAIATFSSLVAGAIASAAVSIPMNVFNWKPNASVSALVMACAILGGAYALGRASLALPARAVDEPIGVRGAVALSRGNEWRLALLIALLPWFVNWSERSLVNTFESAAAYWTISTALYLMFLPVEIALLSVCYAALRDSARSSD